MRRAALLFVVVFASSAWGQCKVLDPELQGAYSGGCVDGLAEGTGIAQGRAEYRGEFKAGRKHGRGVKTWPNGDRYEGAFVEDRKEGRGVYSFGKGPWAGERYEGDFVADLRHGQGVYRWPSGDAYTGPWEEDAPTGTATEMMLARAIYERNARAAVAKEGQKVCRETERRVWLRGTVSAIDANHVVVRVDEPAGEAGRVLRESPLEWTPCW